MSPDEIASALAAPVVCEDCDGRRLHNGYRCERCVGRGVNVTEAVEMMRAIGYLLLRQVSR